ncbi:unnamed protein product [Mytilus coruscus]|uniref:Uncharacterized protein n=1 Tax=Mytilus coruscus TaxID=42192 RepID=A0A6J8BL22_MYTCO|nr:unnamed protein product [Mytilus coruscus]
MARTCKDRQSKCEGKKGKIDFIFKLHKNSQPVPLEFMKEDPKPKGQSESKKGGNKPRCGIEVLFKSSADGRIDAILQCLDKANLLQKAIALGTKIPKLDKGHFEIGRKTEPDIMDIKGIVSNNPKQYQAIQKALESSFSLIQGPPEWMKKKLGEHCPKMVRWYGSSIEDQEFPIPGKTSTLGGGERAVADEQLREYSMHILIRQLGKPYQEEITAFDRQFRQNPDGVDFNDVKNTENLYAKLS